MTDERYIVADTETLKVGCAIIQAAMGGDRALLYKHFDTEDWEVGEVSRMARVPESKIEHFIHLRDTKQYTP